MIVRVLGRGLSLVVTVVATHLLGVQGYGVYTFALAWATLLTIPTSIGLDRLLVRFVARYQAYDDRAKLAGLIRLSDQFIIGLSALVAAAVAVVAGVFASPTYATALLLIIPLIPIQSLMQIAQYTIQGLHHPEQSQIPAIIVVPIVFVGLLLVMDLAGVDVTSSAALLANLAATAVAFGVATALRRRHLHPLLKDVAERSYSRSEWRRALAPLAIVGLISNGNSQIGLVMLGWFGSSTEVGVFGAANKVAQVVFLANMAINAALAPRISRFQALGEHDAIQGAAVRASRFNLAFALPIGAILIAFQGPLLGIFGSGFGHGGTALTILVAGQIFNSFTGSVGVVLLMTGRGKRVALGMGAGLAIDAILCIALTPSLGATGAAIAATADVITWNTVLAFTAWQSMGMNTTAFSRLSRARTP